MANGLMQYIAPDSTIVFHKDIDLDNTFDHTYYFNERSNPQGDMSASEKNLSQDGFFHRTSKTGKIFENNSYQRYGIGVIRVRAPIAEIIGYKYMSFRNTGLNTENQSVAFENKWYYAFITRMTYVNNNTTEVEYEIDPIQTYMFDVNFGQCYIERQHTISDEIGENTQPEPIGVGEYVYETAVGAGPNGSLMNAGKDTRYSNMSIFVACTFTGRPSSGTINYQEINLINYTLYSRDIVNDNWTVVAQNTTAGRLIGITPQQYAKVRLQTPTVPNGVTLTMAFLRSDTNLVSGGAVDYCVGTNLIVLSNNTQTEITIPTDAAYIWLITQVNGTTYASVPFELGTLSDWSFNPNIYGGLYGGSYTGVNLIDFPATIEGAQACTDFLKSASKVANLIDGIISIFMCPTVFKNELDTLTTQNFASTIKVYNDWLIDGYRPKNNKIYTSPYTTLHVLSSDGRSADFPFEFFTQTQEAGTTNKYIVILNEGIAMPVSEIRIIPENYKGVYLNRNETFTIENYPQCSFNTDSYKAWLAQNSTRMNLSIGQTIANAAFNGMLSNVGYQGSAMTLNMGLNKLNPLATVSGALGMASSAIGGLKNTANAFFSVAQILNEKKLASTMPPHASGQNTGTLNIAKKEFGFHYYYCRPRDEYARIIDEFFSRFGYAINRNQVPNFCARTRYTYIKTADCTINGNIPNEASEAITSILNNGITFWYDKSAVGIYEGAGSAYDNTIISG